MEKQPGVDQEYTSAVDSIDQYLVKSIDLGQDESTIEVVGEVNTVGHEPVYKPSLTQESCSSAAFIALGARILDRQQDLERALKVGCDIQFGISPLSHIT